MKIQISFN